MTIEGLVTTRSGHGPEETMRRFEDAVRGRDLTVFVRIDHAASAAEVDMALRPTVLLIFGAAKGGTPLMQAAQTAGIDLPLKALVWEDGSGTTFLSYNAPVHLALRHGLDVESGPVAAMTKLLDAMVAEAVVANP